jgi:hypothetical protein
MIRASVKMYSSFACAALLLWGAVPAQAVSWHGIAANKTLRAEVDTDSLERGKEGVKAWDEESYARPEQARPGDFYFRLLKSFTLYRCGKRSTGYLLKVYYGENDAYIKTVTPTDLFQENAVIPGSLEELKYEFVCNYKEPVKRIAKAAVAEAKAPSKPTATAVKAVTKPAKKPASKPALKPKKRSTKLKKSQTSCQCPPVPAKPPAIPEKPVAPAETPPSPPDNNPADK